MSLAYRTNPLAYRRTSLGYGGVLIGYGRVSLAHLDWQYVTVIRVLQASKKTLQQCNRFVLQYTTEGRRITRHGDTDVATQTSRLDCRIISFAQTLDLRWNLIMAIRDFLPAADAAMLAWSKNFNAAISGSPTSVGLTSAQASEFAAALNSYETAYQVAFDAATRTRPAITAKDTTKATLDRLARQLVRIVQAFPGTTDEQRRLLRINVRKQRSVVPAPSARPVVEIASVVMRTMTINIYDPASATKRNKPEGVVGAKLYTFLGDSYPSNLLPWSYVGDVTTSRSEITLQDTVASGAPVWICAVWYNRKGEVGPQSSPVSTNVQGGGSLNVAAIRIAA